MMNYMFGNGGYTGWGMGGGLMMLLVWALVILSIAALVKYLMQK